MEGACLVTTDQRSTLVSRSTGGPDTSEYSDTSANEDNSFRNHILQPKSDFPQVFIVNRLIRSGCCPLFKDKFYKIVKSTL